MNVVKRNGKKSTVSFDKITRRITDLCWNVDKKFIDPCKVAQKTISSIYNNITTQELDLQSARVCANLSTEHPDYNKLAANILISNLHKSTEEDYGLVIDKLYNKEVQLISQDVYNFAKDNITEINKMFDYSKDYNYDFFGFQTLERAYLIRVGTVIIERPQHMLMRVAIGHYCKYTDSLKNIEKMYNNMADGYYTPATPTLYNCGTRSPQCSSCFVLSTEDSIDGIFKTISDCAKISKLAGGIGLDISNVRAEGSLIRGTNGTSNGIIPMAQVYNNVARYIDQGGNKRNGAIALYLEPWHADIYGFIDLKKNIGSETNRARDIFLALWVCDLFMKRVEEDGLWSLMCPDTCKGLSDVYGDEFEKLYKFYENNKMYIRQVQARDLFDAILSAQSETGVPYFLFKDSVNLKSNQKNVGTIKGSNLCAEIVIYHDTDEYAVCTLSSIALPKFVEIENGTPTYNFKKLAKMAGLVCRNLNRVIDINLYPTIETEKSTMKHRPIGIGVQGLADTFAMMEIPFDSVEASKLNKQIFETIYYGAVYESCELAKVDGPYESFEGSPFSEGKLQFDLWNVQPSDHWNWDKLKDDVKKYGTRNSLLTALMPTASTSQILGNTEAFEPIASNIYLRHTLAGDFLCVNKHLVKSLIKLGLWNDEMKQKILYYKGSIQKIKDIPTNIKNLYKIAPEIKQKVIIDLAIGRGPYVDQTQSMNLFFDKIDKQKLMNCHFYSWKNGLKTGMYYLRSRPVVDSTQFSLDSDLVYKLKMEDKENQIIRTCPIGDKSSCEACSG